ncbi:MAG: bifunctional UDP-N-acetylglucosamine diphosphorylase/glucosamine-1-phosphate N-acetyltransferase GlmU [Acidimicrobiia bacterium]
MSTHVLVLAAGQGKRMMSDLPKVAHLAAGRPLVNWVLDSVAPLAPASTVVVLGHGADHVRRTLPAGTTTALQERQLGTGHAARVGLDAIRGLADDDVVVILYGDVPLLTSRLIEELASLGAEETARLVVAVMDDPTGYGRIIRDVEGRVAGVVEERDCTPDQRSIKEVNAGIYAVRAGRLVAALGQATDDNHQAEFYLTDVIGILAGTGDRLTAVEASSQEVQGINSQDQLASAQRELQRRVNQRLMESGVWMLDPERTYIDDTVEVAPGARIYPGVHLEGSTTVGPDARVGPDVFAKDSSIGAGSTVWYAVLRSAVVGDECEVGPFASLRPGTVLARGAKAGTFVETKNTTLGEGAKAPHLSYLGDATIGAGTNIGAGAITCNYDGFEKHHTEIGENVFIGSDTMLVAPVSIGDGAVTGAGSVITQDVPAGSLAVERAEQREIPGYSERRKAERAALDAED